MTIDFIIVENNTTDHERKASHAIVSFLMMDEKKIK